MLKKLNQQQKFKRVTLNCKRTTVINCEKKSQESESEKAARYSQWKTSQNLTFPCVTQKTTHTLRQHTNLTNENCFCLCAGTRMCSCPVDCVSLWESGLGCLTHTKGLDKADLHSTGV